MTRIAPGFDHRIADWLEADPNRAPTDVLSTVVAALPSIPQARRGLLAPGRFPTMPALSRATAIAAVALVAVVGAGGITYFAAGGPGSSPTLPPTPTLAPTAAPTADPIPEVKPDVDLEAGTYIAHPLPAPADSLGVTFTVPEGWVYFGDSLIPPTPPDTGAPGGMAFQFIDVIGVNPDPCRWSGTADDVPVGEGVDALVEALGSIMGFDVSAPSDVRIGGHPGKRVDITAPTAPFTDQEAEVLGCDENVMRLWTTSSFGPNGIYIQGPANRWQTNILDVGGTRFVVVVQDFPGTKPADRATLDAIVDSLIIEP